VKVPRAPGFEERRTADFSAELRTRAQAWVPFGDLAGGQRDFGRALLEIAARFSSEVAERLDNVGEKMRRGFLDWLAVRGIAARPSRLPVVFKLAEAAQEPVLASEPVQLQVESNGSPVVFETEKDLRVVPGRLDVVVGVDADKDKFYLPPPGLSDLKPLEPLPTQWVLKSYASSGATKLQLDPDAGLEAEMLIEAAGQQYRIIGVDNEIVTIEPALAAELPQSSIVRKITTFVPFDGTATNRQEHSLYLGHMELFNIEAAATIEVVGATTLRTGVTWQYWGKVDGNDETDWQPLDLAADPQADAVVLEKKKGAVEPREIDGKSSRWVRAFQKTVENTSSPLLQTDVLELRVNCKRGTIPCPPNSSLREPAPAAEAMANTTPLVLDGVFFPLGKEPRQFDAFYLGSEEAFSKKGAKVQLCFEMADPTFSALSAVSGVLFGNTSVLAGVGKDRALHLYEFKSSTGDITDLLGRSALQPPLPGYSGQTKPGNTVQLDQQPSWRLPMWSESDFPPWKGFCVGVAGGDAIWIWHEHPIPTNSGWIELGRLSPGETGGSTPVSGLVYLSGTPSKIMALHRGLLFERDWPNGTKWTPVPTDVELKSIVPVLVADAEGRLVTSLVDGMVGISDDNKLFSISASGACTQLGTFSSFDCTIRPVAIMDGASMIVLAVDNSNPQNLVSFAPPAITTKELLGVDDQVTGGLDVLVSNGVHFIVSVKSASGDYLASWSPFALNPDEQVLLKSMIPPSIGPVGGAPTLLGQHVLIPSTRADVLVAEFDVTGRRFRSANIEIGVVVPDSIPPLAVDDLVVRTVNTLPKARIITQAGLAKDGEVFYPLDSEFPSGATGKPIAYNLSSTLTGTFTPPHQLKLASGDFQTTTGDWLRMDKKFFKVKSVDPNDPTVVTIMGTNGKNPPNKTTGIYVRPISTDGRVVPFMRLNPLVNGDWDASVLTRIPLFFPHENPKMQRAKAFSVGPGNHPSVVVLEEDFQPVVAIPAKFVLDPSASGWSRVLGDTSANPELSWEYWNGKGWWKLDVALDSTLNLKSTGAVQFEVPADITSGDWSGKTNFWIRARLIGGDYGREKVTVHNKPLPDGSTEQTIDRSIEGIRPPSVVQLHISYSVCDPVQPTFVLAQDSGSIRDQSNANSTAGAQVEAFVPLALALGRLSQTGFQTSLSGDCPPECQCHSKQGASTDMSTGVSARSVVPTQSTGGRALFIGLDATLSGAPVNVVLLVEHEQDHSQLLPLKVEALVADHFVPIVADDGTRAVGESGLLSMAFAIPPTRGELFGKTLTWLRLSPKAGTDPTRWTPSLRGAYLNAVWASATETLTRELVGSSDGSPNLTLRLARPPVLHGTLELRVKEPLGDEERAALCKDDAQRVLDQVQDLPGDWVLWKPVSDPGDEAATERVYAFDESTGEIRFGDGQHGMIPPIGRDSIVAFSYQRTEPPKPGSDTVPGNLIAPRTALNLVSPVESVEGVFAADQAAGGAPPEPDDRVLRFGFTRLRHRNRAVTTQDVEDLALQSSPDIAHARCLLRRGSVRLVIVMRGKNPIPNAAQIRELHRLLSSVAPTALGAQGMLQIIGPSIRRLRVDLTFRLDSLDHAGALSEDVKKRLVAFFDTATGGIDRDGWGLGGNPSEEDIALALVDVNHLQILAAVTLHEVAGNGTERAWPATLKPVELAALDDDPVRIQFETAEVMA